MEKEEKTEGKDQSIFHEIQDKLCDLVWNDEGMRKKIDENPKEVIEKELGIKLRDGLDVGVIDQAENKFYFILPPRQNQQDAQALSDEELEQMAGGFDVMSMLGGIMGGGGGASATATSGQYAPISTAQQGPLISGANVNIGQSTIYSNQKADTKAIQTAVNVALSANMNITIPVA